MIAFPFLYFGIIPAYAGQIKVLCKDGGIPEDHPRIRGTNVLQVFFHNCFTGSSPHTRDKLDEEPSSWELSRIIPAYAGQILPPFFKKADGEDHPRIRGTNINFGNLSLIPVGSSPHTRDK